MTIQSINTLSDGESLSADIVIVGGGACGLTLARALSGAGIKLLVVESGGTQEDLAHADLDTVEIADGSWQPAEFKQRETYHRNLTRFWDGQLQTYGVRCRGLGGSTQAWAGKSAPFDEMDFADRPWVPLSNWPITQEELAPYIESASELLDLGLPIYDESLWERMGRRPPQPSLSGAVFRSTFWQFARSRRNPTDIMRFGAEYLAKPPDDVQLLTEATVTKLRSNPEGRAFVGLNVQSLSGTKVTINARTCVLAASAIENARLLLLSKDVNPAGLGNAHDRVGRCLMDHPTTTIARATPQQIAAMSAWFGLFGFRQGARTSVYMHGLALSADYQRKTCSLNGAVFVTEERARDDPFAALRRLLRKQSAKPFQDLYSIAKNPIRSARGIAARALAHGYLPSAVNRITVDMALRFFPNTIAQDYQSGHVAVKLDGLRFEATTEQPPDPENRVTLSQSRDVFGLRRPRVAWKPGSMARENLLRMGEEFAGSFVGAGMTPPRLEPWVIEKDPEAAVVMDLGHSMGTTRMSSSPKDGVVDHHCAVHGVEGLYVAGGSVLPTSGHANPTLMMLAMTLRLGKTLRRRFGKL